MWGSCPLVVVFISTVLMLHGCGNGGSNGSSTTCSKEICDLQQEYVTVHLEAKRYVIDRQIFLPKGTRLIGAGINQTFIVAHGDTLTRKDFCRNKNECRRGLILNTDTYVSGFTFVGRDHGRWGDNDCLYGGAPLETPGCQDSYCRVHGDSDCGVAGEIGPDFCTAGGCEGVKNVLVEDVAVEAYTTQTLVWVPLTPPGNQTCMNLTFRGLHSNGTWADGVNIHGEHTDVVVENTVIRNSGDDGFAMWSNGDKLTNIVFRNNTAEHPRCCNRVWDGEPRYPPPAPDCSNSTQGGPLPYPGWGVNCFAMYGGGTGNKIIDSTCVSTYWGFMAFHGATPGDLGFHGSFAENASVTLSGNVVTPGVSQGPSCCAECPICYWKSFNSSTWKTGMKPLVDGGDCDPSSVSTSETFASLVV